MPKMPKPLSLVKFVFGDIPKNYHDKYPFLEGQVCIFHGEIPNMPGHCVVSDRKTGKLFSCYHTENFIELDPDEV